MPRGGYREKAGRKPGWEHPETTVIRVPKVLAGQLMEIARELDKGVSLDSITESKESDNELVTESIKYILARWKERADSASPKNSDWRKARQILAELEPVVYEGAVLESVAKSKEHPGQMSLLKQDEHFERVTDSENASFESVTDSNAWLSTKECWQKLGEPVSYDAFRKYSPEKLFQRYGIRSDLSRKKKYNSRWLKLCAQDNAESLNQVNPLPEGSEQSGEG